MTTTTSEPKKDAPASAAPGAGTAPAQPAPPSDTVSLTINGQKLTAKKGTLLVEAAKQVGIEIPVFCYHPKLKPVGACRMCLVEIEKMPRLQTACTTPVGEGMVVKTQSELAKGGQSAVLSLLLANHPLDCPVCDKGGECPLQDNTFGYGPGQSKFEEEKRHNEKAFELSDKIVLDRERCILCYRCVRFHEEIPGDRALAVLDRGGHGEIGVLPGETYDSPFQGNTIDICPVGALTSRQYRFRSRPWDLKTSDSIACDDPVGSNIEVDTRDGRVLRVRPRENLEVNDAWISDRTRFGTVPPERTGRLGQPLVRGADGKLHKASWADALDKAAAMIRTGRTGWVVAPTVTNEAMGVAAVLGDDVGVAPGVPAWGVKGSLQSIAKSKSIVVIGMDPWTEIPMLALWIHRAVAQTAVGNGGATLVVMNEKNGLFRDTKHWVKAGPGMLKAALQGLVNDLEAQKDIAAELKGRPTTLLVGEELARDPEALPLLDKLANLLEADGSGGLVGAPSVFVNGRGALEIFGDRATIDPLKDGILKRAMQGQHDTLVVVGPAQTEAVGKQRMIWLQHSLPDAEHGDAAEVPSHVDVVLPLAHPYEQAGSFTNLEGRAQAFEAAGIPPGSLKDGALPDWLALVRLGHALEAKLPLELRALREHLARERPFFARIPRTAKARLAIV